LGYLPGLDGIRAIAIIGVLLYHLDLPWIPGGFLGVDVFFVLSGFLITSILLTEIDKRGGVNFREFYIRRGRRLLPALYLLLAVVAIAAAFWVQDAAAAARRDIVAAFFYVTNWVYILADQSYFEQIGRPPLLQHLWSLAVEEQFYLIWPAVVVLVVARGGRGRLALVALVGAVLSTIWMITLAVRGDMPGTVDPSRVYFGSDTHAMGLLLGAALACVWRPARMRSMVAPSARKAIDTIGVGALALLLVVYLTVPEDSYFLYRFGGFLWLSVVVVVLLVMASHPAGRLGPILGRQPLRYIGERSYGLYLWHWPIFMVTRPGLDIPLEGFPALLLRLGLTFAVAELSYRFVELPIRHGALTRAWAHWKSVTGEQKQRLRQRAIAVAAASALAIGAVGVGLANAEPPPDDSLLVSGPAEVSLDEGDPAVSPDPATTDTPSDTQTDVPTDDATSGSTDSPSPQGPSNEPGGDTAAPSPEPSTTGVPKPSSTGTAPAKPSAKPSTTPPLPPATGAVAPQFGASTALGDSVLLGARVTLRRYLPKVGVDAAVGRQAGVILDRIQAYHAKGKLAPVVIIHTGTNGEVTSDQLTAMLTTLKDRRLVVVVNTDVPRRWESGNNERIAAIVPKFPNAVLADWKAVSDGRREYFVTDGVHLTGPGMKAYASLIQSTIYAKLYPGKRPPAPAPA